MGKTENVRQTPYAEWLEGMIKAIMDHRPDRVGVCMMLPNGQVCTGYYGECCHQDKALMSYNIGLDAIGDALGPGEGEGCDNEPEDEES